MTHVKLPLKTLVVACFVASGVLKTLCAVVNFSGVDFINIVSLSSFRDWAIDFHGPYTFTVYLENLFYRAWLWLPVDHTNLEAVISRPPTSLDGYLTIFTLKLPLILFDLLTGGVIYLIVRHLTSSSRPALGALALWLFNPYTTLMVEYDGTWDIFSTFFLTAAWWVFLKKRMFTSGILLALSAVSRFFTVALLPFFLVFAVRKRMFRGTLLFVSGFAVLIAVAVTPINLVYGEAVLEMIKELSVGGNKEFTWFFGHLAQTAAPPDISVSVVAVIYFATLILASRHWRLSDRYVSDGVLVVLIAYLAFSHWNRYYSTWVLPFITVEYILQRRTVKERLYTLLFILYFAGLTVFSLRWHLLLLTMGFRPFFPATVAEIMEYWHGLYRTYLVETFGRCLLATASIAYITLFSLRNMPLKRIAER